MGCDISTFFSFFSLLMWFLWFRGIEFLVPFLFLRLRSILVVFYLVPTLLSFQSCLDSSCIFPSNLTTKPNSSQFWSQIRFKINPHPNYSPPKQTNLILDSSTINSIKILTENNKTDSLNPNPIHWLKGGC